MISSVVFVNIKGQILLCRAFKDDVTRSQIQNYCQKMVMTKFYRQNPIYLLNGSSFIAVPFRKLIFLAVTKINLNALMAIEFLYKLIFICNSYCNGQVTEKDIIEKCSLFYEILDQVMDYGCPQTTDLDILINCIQQQKYKEKQKFDLKAYICRCNSISWRPSGIYYKKNEIYLDIIQTIAVIFSSNGTILSSIVTGVINVSSRLSGFPQCKLGINDSLMVQNQPIKQKNTFLRGITIDEMKFHKCVKFSKYKQVNQRTIIFSPPDGTFELMSYRTTQNICVPFIIMPFYSSLEKEKFQIRVIIKSVYGKDLIAKNVIAKIPVPRSTNSVTYHRVSGRAQFQPQGQAILWKIQKFQGKRQYELFCEIKIDASMAQKQSLTEPSIKLEFQLPMFTASGLKPRFLRIYEKSGYKPSILHRSLTKPSDYKHLI